MATEGIYLSLGIQICMFVCLFKCIGPVGYLTALSNSVT